MTPWPFALTTSAVVHGAVYLLGGAAPIDAVYLDGRLLPGVISTTARYGEGGSGSPEQAVSVLVPLPDWVRAGRHRLRLVRGQDSWRRPLDVAVGTTVRLPDPATGMPSGPEVRAWCARDPEGGGQGGSVKVRGPSSGYSGEVGVIVRDAAGLRLLPIKQPVADDWVRRDPDYWTTGHIQPGTVIQRVYADGSLGERWRFDEEYQFIGDQRYGSSCHDVEQPLPGGPGIPLWKDAASGPP